MFICELCVSSDFNTGFMKSVRNFLFYSSLYPQPLKQCMEYNMCVINTHLSKERNRRKEGGEWGASWILGYGEKELTRKQEKKQGEHLKGHCRSLGELFRGSIRVVLAEVVR